MVSETEDIYFANYYLLSMDNNGHYDYLSERLYYDHTYLVKE